MGNKHPSNINYRPNRLVPKLIKDQPTMPSGCYFIITTQNNYAPLSTHNDSANGPQVYIGNDPGSTYIFGTTKWNYDANNQTLLALNDNPNGTSPGYLANISGAGLSLITGGTSDPNYPYAQGWIITPTGTSDPNGTPYFVLTLSNSLQLNNTPLGQGYANVSLLNSGEMPDPSQSFILQSLDPNPQCYSNCMAPNGGSLNNCIANVNQSQTQCIDLTCESLSGSALASCLDDCGSIAKRDTQNCNNADAQCRSLCFCPTS